jgi:hypothetical protein
MAIPVGDFLRPVLGCFFIAGTPFGRMQLTGNPEKELEEFLMPLPAWARRFLQLGFPSLVQSEIADWARNPDEVFKLKTEYERILQRIPVKWREYRERLKREADQTARYEAQFLVPKGKPGAPRKNELAQKAALLQSQGMNFPQIAAELNKTLGEDNRTTADAVRKLLKRHPQPDKTQTPFASRT